MVHNTVYSLWLRIRKKILCVTSQTDLPKAFDCLSHSLLIVKLHAYAFNKTSTEYLKDYSSHREKKIKINKTFSNCTNIRHGVPQGSILGPLFFNVFLCGLFLSIPNTNLLSYADDNTLFAMGSSELEKLIKLRLRRKILLSGFRIAVWKWIRISFTFFSVIKKIIRWILVTRSSQVSAVKNLRG